jgi:O-antigen/teichoic acid export membrane protein
VQLFYGDRLRVVRDSLTVTNDRSYASAILKNYSDFPKFRLPQTLLNSLSQNLPAVMFVAFFGPAIGGFYALARRVVALPGALISESVRQVFYQKATDLNNRGVSIFDATLKATLGLATVGVIPFGAIVLFGPTLFSVIFGQQWRTAGVFASWLAVWIFFGFCNVPSVSVLTVSRHQKQFLIYEVIQFLIRVISLVVGAITRKPIVAIMLYAVTGSALNLALITLVHILLYRGRKVATSLSRRQRKFLILL